MPPSLIAGNLRLNPVFEPCMNGISLLALCAVTSAATSQTPSAPLVHPPMRIADVGAVTPMGLMVGAHVTPSDHIYLFPKDMKAPRDAFDVFATADGAITRIQHRTSMQGSTEQARAYDDYRIFIEHSPTLTTYYDLVTKLAPDIEQAARGGLGERGGFRGCIPVKAGQVIGKVGQRSLDMGVVDQTVARSFIVPEHYALEPWKLHTADPFDYMAEPFRSELLKLNARKAAPLGGRIDFDVDGTLSGNWFLENTNGYSGAGDPRGYWMGHLAFVRHHIAAENIVISIGDFAGQPKQFWVKDNAPDPAKVTPETGITAYELVWGSVGSDGRKFEGLDTATARGVLLAQVLPGRKLRVEILPGHSGPAPKSFSAAAKTYER